MFRRSTHSGVELIHPAVPLVRDAQADFDETVAACLEAGNGRVVFDLREVSLIDSVGLEGLVHLQEQCLRRGGALKLAGPSNLCSDVLHVTGVDEQIEIFPDPVAAVGSFSA